MIILDPIKGYYYKADGLFAEIIILCSMEKGKLITERELFDKNQCIADQSEINDVILELVSRGWLIHG